ncbi:hypothetical protein [Vibrio penaeicida]|uniref:hypothetical protein n=1 Tax=Vibrio penaeicida TaxID=104609 RepID=UPI001CC689A9|nr:hypothetical protein [Vibrio penaeicida]
MPRSLSVSGGFGAILLHWAPALYAGHAHTEIWRASSNSLGLAQRIATTPATTLGDIVRPAASTITGYGTLTFGALWDPFIM